MFCRSVLQCVGRQGWRRFCATSSSARREKCLNNVTLLGRTGAAPQTRGTEERPIVTFPMATNTYFTYDDGTVKEAAQWHRISVFRPQLQENVLKFVTKGQRVLVQGSVKYYQVQDDYGNASTVTSIVADDVIFVSDSSRALQTEDSAVDDMRRATDTY